MNTATSHIPKHIAIVMDGNGRWAKKRMMPRIAGHRAGEKAVQKTIEACARLGVGSLTIYAFSQENWARPKEEVMALMELLVDAMHRGVKELHQNQIRLNFIGDLTALPEKLQSAVDEAQALTQNNTRLNLNVALNYGGQWDIAQAVQKTLSDASNIETLSVEQIAQGIENNISTAKQPHPDLFIRTAGEQRISNFLLWQLAYTELYVTDVLWPDFDEIELEKSITWFNTRVRKFGQTQEQLDNA